MRKYSDCIPCCRETRLDSPSLSHFRNDNDGGEEEEEEEEDQGALLCPGGKVLCSLPLITPLRPPNPPKKSRKREREREREE